MRPRRFGNARPQLSGGGDQSEEKGDQCQTLLLVGLGREGRLAIPLSLVARLEEIPLTQVEFAAGREVVQYRGQILPLIHLVQVLQTSRHDRNAVSDRLQVVVYSDGDRSVGLVVDRILDIVETRLEIKHAARRPGVLGSAVIQQRVTDLLDVPGLIRTADPSLFQAAAS